MTHRDSRPDWLDRLGDQLERAADELPQRETRRRRTRRIILTAVMACLVIPGIAVAAVTHPWNANPPQPAPSSGIIADPDEPIAPGTTTTDPNGQVVPGNVGQGDDVVPGGPNCRDPQPFRQATISTPPPKAIADHLAVLRRPTTDEPPRDLSMPDAAIYTQSLRTATANDGTQIAIYIVGNDPSHTVPNTPACARLRHQPPQPIQICFTTERPNGHADGGACSTPGRIDEGQAIVTGDLDSDIPKGGARITGIVPDGVSRVRLTFHPGTGLQPVLVAVRDNVFSYVYNGSAAVPPTVAMLK